MNTYNFILELLNNTAGIIVAIIAAATAFGVYSHKQNWNEKHKHYKALMGSVSSISSKTKEIIHSIGLDTMYNAHDGVDNTIINSVKDHINDIRLELPLARAFISHKSAKLFLEYNNKIEKILMHYQGDIIVDPHESRGPLQRKAFEEIDELSENLVKKLSVSMKRDLRIISLS